MSEIHKPGYPNIPYINSLSGKLRSLLQYELKNYDDLYEKHKEKYCWIYDGGIEFEANTLNEAFNLAKEHKNFGFIIFFW